MKREFTVGEMAKVLNVARTTVINWIKEGRMEAFQLPGGNNRVTRENLVKFMNEYNIPLQFLEDSTFQRILIIDDKEKDLKACTKAFEKEAFFKVETAKTAFEAAMQLKSFNPHVIILNINIKEFETKEALQLIRSDPELKESPIIALTGKMNKDEKKKLLDSGFTMCLEKPLNVAELVSNVRNMMGI